jgi:hypothetical protein
MPMEGAMPNYFTINGKFYPAIEAIPMRVGQTLKLRFIGSHIMAIHPMHIHGGPFEVGAVDGETLQRGLVASLAGRWHVSARSGGCPSGRGGNRRRLGHGIGHAGVAVNCIAGDQSVRSIKEFGNLQACLDLVAVRFQGGCREAQAGACGKDASESFGTMSRSRSGKGSWLGAAS